jgi:hypothetical protein
MPSGSSHGDIPAPGSASCRLRPLPTPKHGRYGQRLAALMIVDSPSRLSALVKRHRAEQENVEGVEQLDPT